MGLTNLCSCTLMKDHKMRQIIIRYNKLSLNVSKPHAVMFKQGHMNIPSNLNVKIGNQIN